MSYRNDHDAALARVDALEAENAELRAMLRRVELVPPRAPTPPPRAFAPPPRPPAPPRRRGFANAEPADVQRYPRDLLIAETVVGVVATVLLSVVTWLMIWLATKATP